MNNKDSKIIIDKDYSISEIDPRLYGNFVEHMGRCVYGGIYEPGHPDADEQGFRKDVLNVVRKLNIPVVRYPGGNFVSGYRWEDGIGPKENRPARIDLAWNSLEPNHMGLNEFMSWCKKADTEAIMAVNLGTRGAEEACNILEYCNHKRGTYWSDLRIKHGFSEPHNIKLWCLGNEMDGPWQIGRKTAEEYGRLASETGKLMKILDPGIELVACGSSAIYLDSYPEWDAKVLELCYEHIDYLAVHMYFNSKGKTMEDFIASPVAMESYIESIVGVCKYIKAKKRGKKDIALSFDEWNVVPGIRLEDEKERWKIGPAICEGSYTMADCLVFGSMLISLIRHSDHIKIACLAQLVNMFGPFMTIPGGGIWMQTIFYPYLHASLYGRGRALNTLVSSPLFESKEYGEVPLLDSIAVENQEKQELTVFVINRSIDRALELEFDIRGFEEYRVTEHIVLGGAGPDAHNSADMQDSVIPYLQPHGKGLKSKFSLKVPKASWNVIRLRKERI